MKRLPLLLIFLTLLILPFCTTSKKTLSKKKRPPVSYATDVSPIIQSHCTPCHFPDGGKKKFLDTYAAVSTNIDAMLFRVQLPRDSIRFMPWKSKKEPLSDSLIQVLKLWKEQGMGG